MLGIINITFAFPLFFQLVRVCVCVFFVFRRFFVCSSAAPLPGFICLPFHFPSPSPPARQLTCSQASRVALGRNTWRKWQKLVANSSQVATPTRLQLAAWKAAKKKGKERERERKRERERGGEREKEREGRLSLRVKAGSSKAARLSNWANWVAAKRQCGVWVMKPTTMNMKM